MGTFYVKLNETEDEAPEINLELKRSFIEAQASGTEMCTLRLTKYGDMRSFISDSSQKQPESYGTNEELV